MLLSILGAAVPILLLIIFIIGIFLSFRFRFMFGSLFFFILLVNKILQFYFQSYIKHLSEQQIPQNMSVGTLVVAFQVVSNIIEVTAFIILLVGLYKKWRERGYHSTKVEELRPKT